VSDDVLESNLNKVIEDGLLTIEDKALIMEMRNFHLSGGMMPGGYLLNQETE
jgi:hypothetical protein